MTSAPSALGSKGSKARRELCPLFLKCTGEGAGCSKGSATGEIDAAGRITRSKSKEWRLMFGSNCKGKGKSCGGGAMNPPQVPAQHSRKIGLPGVLTRKKFTEQLLLNRSTKSDSSLDVASTTSDYGSLSEDSRQCSLEQEFSPFSSGESCHCGSLSGIESLNLESEDDSGSEPEKLRQIDLSTTGWDSDANERSGSTQGWDSDAEIEYFRCLREQTPVTVLTKNQVTAIIPLVNRSGYEGKFKIHLMDDNSQYYRQGLHCCMRVHHVSPIVSMEPHGVHFSDSKPVLLVIPLKIEPHDDGWLSCLFSNTTGGQQPLWKRLPRAAYFYRNGSVVITARHFSLFTVMLEEPFPEVMKCIRCRTGGRLRIVDVPGVQVEFPRGSLQQDLDAYLRVLYDSEPLAVDPAPLDAHALASPVIMLGPHGKEFDRNRPAVLVTLPVPDYHRIKTHFQGAQLSVWQSSTREDEPLVWEPLEVALSKPMLVSSSCNVQLYAVTFPVHHFSFFKLVWDVLASSLYEAKMGMSYFYPYISFSMMCQAFMEENTGCNRFAMEVICYRSDRCLPEATNYRHRVGASLKPKMVRPGRIIIRLKSQMFEADTEAGEDEHMVKEEPDFRGRDFEKQYACRFKPGANVDRGTFGKVLVERVVSSNNKDPVFEFNLHKTGAENDSAMPVGDERWTVIAMKELASSLLITDGQNWKKFAQYIGFTKSEIRSKLQYSPDPFLAMMNLYHSRGGTPEEFTKALYAVSRDLQLVKNNASGSQSDRSRSSKSAGSGSGSKGSSAQASPGNSRSLLWGFRPWGRPHVNNEDSDSAEESVKTQEEDKAKKRSWSGSGNKAGPSRKRRKFSDVSETVTSSSDEGSGKVQGGKSVSTERHKRDTRKLTDRDLWRVSEHIANLDWRNLGRTLGFEEPALHNLNHAHQSIGFRECTYQMLLAWKSRKPRKCTFGRLYSALIQEKMVSVAKHLVKIVYTDEKSGDSS